MAEEAAAVVAPAEEVEVEEEKETKSPVTTTDLKRKFDDLESEQKQEDEDETVAKTSDNKELTLNTDEVPDAKKPRLEEESDGSALENGHDTVLKLDAPEEENTEMTDSVDAVVENPQNTSEGNAEAENPEIKSENIVTEDVKDVTIDNAQVDKVETQSAEVIPEGDAPKSSDETIKTEDVQQLSGDLPESLPETQSISRKMEVPNNKVGVLIGKSGDTIRTLQLNSGAKIQITRDTEADPHAATRPVELIGTLEHINKAEKLIKDVIAEADAGGSPSLVARGFGIVQATGAADQIQIQVPIEKVGMIIGKGGETIKNLQTRSGAHIQLIPQHLSEGDQSKERTVRVTGDKKQIEVARDMITEVMSQPNRPSHSSGYNQQGYRPRGSSGPPQGVARVPPYGQGRGYDNHQRGMYPSQNPQYMAPPYGDYPPQQNAPRRNFNGGWGDQRHGHMNTAPPRGGYDYYGHGGHAADASAHAPLSNSGTAPAPAHGPPPTHVNYNNYGQPQGPEYGQPGYAQSAHPQQNYGHGNANQVPTQPAYGGQGNAQQGAYQQVANQPGYGQQPYAKPPAYGMPTQAPQAYGPPRAGQPGDLAYQNPAYGQAAPSQQPNPCASQPYPYTSAPPANDGYSQPQTYSAPAYPQPGGQTAPGYAQPGGQAATGYAQGGQAGAGAYGPYSQPGFGEQQVPNNAGYGYQAPDANYGAAPTAAYGAPPAQPTYEQPAAQPGAYPAVPGSAPGYVKNLSPQPVYGQQYDTAQVYGGQH